MRQMGLRQMLRVSCTGLFLLLETLFQFPNVAAGDVAVDFGNQEFNFSGVIDTTSNDPSISAIFGTKYFSIQQFAKQRRHRSVGPIWRPGSGFTGNVIDDCWRRDEFWASNRMYLANCSKGFGSDAMGGNYGRYYVVTTTDDNPVNPIPGSLRYGATLSGPTWIYFAHDMLIVLKKELMVSSFKALDGRGAYVQIAYGACLTVQNVSHVIIHGLHIHDCVPGISGDVKSSAWLNGYRRGSKGNAISISGSNNVWVDHNSLEHCYDGLIDIIHASTDITISNNHFANQDKVMLLGHNDAFSADKIMKVTILYNHFGPGCVQHMPRLRFGYAHVVNNQYKAWLMYAIGGSSDPTIKSEGNYYKASDIPNTKEVTKREGEKGMNWVWRSKGDLFLNGAYFVQSGQYGSADPYYTQEQSFQAKPAALVPKLTYNAGALSCNPKYRC